ncbi:MAG: enoyl-CoA hydratase-related protein [Chloroflexota bacterium]
MPESLVLYEARERAAVLHIHNPPANALSLATLEALEGAVRRALGEDAKVVILTGQGANFCAGADMGELHALAGSAAAAELSGRGQALCDLIETAPKPVIAAINGRYALGGGVELLLACHLRLIEASTQLGSPEVRLGLMVGWGGSQRLPRLVGAGRALELLLTGRRLSAAEAFAMGLVNRVVADGTVLAEALTLAAELAALSAPVLAATLRAVMAGLRQGYGVGMQTEQAEFAALCDRADWREGTRAFMEKRPPRFVDG